MSTTKTLKKMAIEFRLKVVMAERDITSKKLAERSGLAYGTISKLRSSPPTLISIETVDKLCDALKCQPGDLFRHIPDETA